MLRFLTIAFLAVASANVIVDGPCPDVKAMENFNFSEFAGTWYEIAKFANIGEQGTKGKCTTAEYFVDGEKGKVKNSQIIDGVKSYVDGEVSLTEPGKILITYKFGNYVKNSVLWILETDYKNYAIGYSCKFMEKDNKHQDFSWILSRNKSLGDSKAKVDAFYNNFKYVDISNYVYNDYSDEACNFSVTKAITEIDMKH